MSEAMPDTDLSQFLDLFIEESNQYLQTLNQCMLALERTPGDADTLDTMFRAAHSLKGMSATMGYDVLATLAHAAEDVLHKIREGDWIFEPSLVQLLFSAIDSLQTALNNIAAGRTDSTYAEQMIERLQSYEPTIIEPVQPQPIADAYTQAAAAEQRQQATTAMIRIDVQHLDALLDVMTEMLIHRSLLTRLAQRHNLEPLNEALETHNRLLSQLQDAVLQMRMVPVGQVFGRFPRMVRDLLKTEGKEARLIMEGEGVELDRTALEALYDPLMHLLRNAIDHGLETPAEREQVGKPPLGTVRLAARQERGLVIIQVSDDGRGIDAQRVAATAQERGVITAEAVAEMSEAQILALICHPGFSLSEEVTAVSGRGVGMSVVKHLVERLHGSLQIETQIGEGSTFRIELPAMLTLLRALLVKVGSEQYALPTTHIERIVELDPTRVERIGGQRLFHQEGGVLPLVRIGELLNTPGCTRQPRYALVVRRDDQTLGLCVDDVLGHEEIVVNPLPPALHGTPGLSGVTIHGEGQIMLILDVAGL